MQQAKRVAIMGQQPNGKKYQSSTNATVGALQGSGNQLQAGPNGTIIISGVGGVGGQGNEYNN